MLLAKFEVAAYCIPSLSIEVSFCNLIEGELFILPNLAHAYCKRQFSSRVNITWQGRVIVVMKMTMTASQQHRHHQQSFCLRKHSHSFGIELIIHTVRRTYSIL